MRARFVIVALAGTLLAACGASEASGGPEIQATEETGAASSVVEVTMPRSTTTSIAAGPAESVAAHPEVTDDRVYLVGDSITESIASRYSGVVCDALTPLGWNVTVDARQGRTTGEAVQSLRANRSRVGEVVVVLIGHNDGIDPEGYRSQIDRLIGLVPDARRILLLTNYEFERGRDRMNDALRLVAGADGDSGPNDRIQLVDWNTAVDEIEDDAIRGDGVHLTTVGQNALATVIAAALGPAPTAGNNSERPPACTTLRSSTRGSGSGSGSGGSGGGSGGSGGGSGGSGSKTTTTTSAPQPGSSAAPSTGVPDTSGPPATDAPPDTKPDTKPGTSGPPNTAKGSTTTAAAAPPDQSPTT